jgi:histidinol-phosphate aminotransferase
VNSIPFSAKEPYLKESLNRPDWTKDISRDPSKLWLNKNENMDPILNEKIRSLASMLPSFAFNTYPETAKIYVKLAKMDGLKPENFILTPGSDGAIRAVFDVFVKPGDKVLRTQPTFAMYDVYSKMFGAEEVVFNYDATPEGPVLNVAKFFEVIRNQKPKLVCLPNPDSPTGTVFQSDEMKELLRVTVESGSLLLIDEAYHLFYEPTVIDLVNEYPHLLVGRSFSKAWGAAGLRVGYLAGNFETLKLLHKNRPMYEIGTLSVEMLYLLLDCEADVKASVTRLLQGKNYFVREMTALGFKTAPSHGNFLHVAFSAAEAKIAEALKDTVLYRTEFANASCLSGYSRFSLGSEEQFKTIVKRVQSVMT